MKMNQAYTLLPWKKPGLADNEYATSVKWQQNNSKYEIYSTTLEDMDVDKVVQHCLDVKGKIRKEVSNNNHLGPGYFKAFPRTLSVPLMAVWDTVIADIAARLAVAHVPENENNFDIALREFVASNATTQDRHELIQQIRSPTKPRDLGVQQFYYRLIECCCGR